jgi:hypothetical protein
MTKPKHFCASPFWDAPLPRYVATPFRESLCELEQFNLFGTAADFLVRGEQMSGSNKAWATNNRSKS